MADAEKPAAAAAVPGAEVKVASLGGLNLVASLAALSMWSGATVEEEEPVEYKVKAACFF